MLKTLNYQFNLMLGNCQKKGQAMLQNSSPGFIRHGLYFHAEMNSEILYGDFMVFRVKYSMDFPSVGKII